MRETLPRKNSESLTDWTLRFMADALRQGNPVIADHLDRRGKVSCDSCGGSGLVPANSGSDSADFKCQECNGKGVRP